MPLRIPLQAFLPGRSTHPLTGGQENTMQMKPLILIFGMAASSLTAQTLAPRHAKCEITPSEEAGKFSLHVFDETDCPEGRNCGSNFSHESMSRFAGITPADLNR